MNKEYIADIISGIDDRFVEEAAQIKKRKKSIYKFAGIAACVALAVTAGALFSQSDFISPDPEIIKTETGLQSAGGDKNTAEVITTPAIYYEDAELEPGTEIEMAIAPKWDDRITSDKYPELITGDSTYSSQRTEISPENIGEFITDAVMSGYDIYTDKTYTANAKAYAIKGISTDCAVAVEIGDEDKYYVYVNVWYTPETLGDLINSIDMKNTVFFGKAYKNYTDYDKNEHVSIVFADFDDSIVWNMILSDTSIKNIEYDRFEDMLISLSVDIPILGYKNISLGVSGDGYIVTNIMGTQKCFFIGTQKAEAFDSFVTNNVAFKEMVTVYEKPDGAIPGKGESGETTPGYNPAEAEMISPGYNPETDAAPPVSKEANAADYPADTIIEETTHIN